MHEYSRKFFRKTFESMNRDSIPDGPGYQLFLPKKDSDYFDRKRWAKNAAQAEAILGVPPDKWDEATTLFRKRFGVNRFLEGLFLLGFVLGWVEAKASLSGNFARRLRTSACKGSESKPGGTES